MKIMILVTDLPLNLNRITGGVQSAVINLLEGFSKSASKVRVLSFGDYSEKEFVVTYSPSIDIVYCFAGNMPVNSLNYFFNCPAVVKRHISDFKPDIIHYETGDAFLFTRLRGLKGTKNLLTLHGHALAEAKHKKRFSERLNLYVNGIIEKILIPGHLIFISDYSRKEIKIKDGGLQPTIYNSISSGYFNIPSKESFDAMLLFVGVISRRKNLLDLLEVLNTLKQGGQIYHLDIIGDFDDAQYKEEVLGYINTNGLAPLLTFHGWQSQVEVKSFLEKADILVLPSKQETLPMSIAEAMASGKTVVATKIGGIPEMIRDGEDGFLFAVNDTKKLTAILQHLYANPFVCRQVAIQARNAAREKFYCENIAAKTLAFYDRILHPAVN